MNGSDRNRVVIADIIAKAWQQPDYKAAFIADPKKILWEAGIEDIPETMQIRVLENTANRKYFVLPVLPFSDYRDELMTLFQNALSLSPGLEIVFVQDTENLQYIVLATPPPGYKGEFTASHVDLLTAAGWESVNLATAASGVMPEIPVVVVHKILIGVHVLAAVTTAVFTRTRVV